MTDFTTISCDRFDELLPDLLEGTLSPRDRQAAELHQADCDRCAALVLDLDGIRAGAAALPTLRPSRDLWSGIAERIEAPVVALAPRAERTATPRRAAPWRSVAAAAALVALTAGVTHQVTVRAMRPDAGIAAAPAASGARTPAPGIAPAGSASPGTPVERQPSASEPAMVAANAAGRRDDVPPPRPLPKDPPQRRLAPAPTEPVPAALASAPRASNAIPASAPATAASAVYDREVELLRQVLDQRRRTLDPATIAIVEQNLDLIDRAIGESRDALRRDPASSLLSRQLDLALEKKVQLLRRAAMLPART